MKIAERIQQLRKSAGYSQEKLAELLHVTRQAVSKWESGVTLPTLDNLTELSNIFNIPISDLLQPQEEVSNHTSDSTISSNPNGPLEESNISTELLKEFLQENKELILKREKKFIYMLSGIGLTVILITVLLVNYFNGALDSLETQVNSLNSQLSTYQYDLSQYDQVSYSYEPPLKDNSIVSDYSCVVADYDPKSRQVTLSLSATPKIYSDHMSAIFTASADGMETVSMDGILSNNNIFSCSMTLPVNDDIKISVSFKKDDEIQSENLETLDSLKSDYFMTVNSVYNGSHNFDDTLYALNGEVVTTIRPTNNSLNGDIGVNNWPVSATVQIIIDGEVVEEYPIDLSNLLDNYTPSIDTVIIGSDGTSTAMGESEYYFYTPINIQYPTAKNSSIEVLTIITDNYGVEETQVVYQN